MMLDNALMFFKNAAFDAASNELDLGVENVGRGEPLTIFFSGGSDMAGVLDIVLESSPDQSTWNSLQTLRASLPNGQEGVAMLIPHPSERYLRLNISSLTAGTNINAGVVLDAQAGM